MLRLVQVVVRLLPQGWLNEAPLLVMSNTLFGWGGSAVTHGSVLLDAVHQPHVTRSGLLAMAFQKHCCCCLLFPLCVRRQEGISSSVAMYGMLQDYLQLLGDGLCKLGSWRAYNMAHMPVSPSYF